MCTSKVKCCVVWCSAEKNGLMLLERYGQFVRLVQQTQRGEGGCERRGGCGRRGGVGRTG